MKRIYDYIVFTDSDDYKYGNHIVERIGKDYDLYRGKEAILSFRTNLDGKDKYPCYYERRIRFSSSNLTKVKEFAILDNL